MNTWELNQGNDCGYKHKPLRMCVQNILLLNANNRFKI